MYVCKKFQEAYINVSMKVYMIHTCTCMWMLSTNLVRNASTIVFLRTARSFYGSLWYLLTYVQVIFRRSHPTLKLIKQKMSEIIQVNVPNFFYFAEIQKMTKLGPKNRFWDLKIKINPSGSNPTINPLFFEIQT